MAKQKSKLDIIHENQLNLFELIEEINPKKFARADYQVETKPLGLRIKETIAEAIKNSGMKRYEIAGLMSENLGIEITEGMLNSYTAESKDGYRMPAEYFPIFCRITKDYAVLEILVAASGGRMVKSEEIYYLEMGRIQQAEKALKKKHRQLQSELQNLHGGGADG